MSLRTAIGNPTRGTLLATRPTKTTAAPLTYIGPRRGIISPAKGWALTSTSGRVGPSRRWYSSSRPICKEFKPPLPPSSKKSTTTTTTTSPSKAKQEFLKSRDKQQEHDDPLVQMAKLQKELDIVRDRAAERLEQKLQKSVWRRLTDPLRRHSHSWINVGAVLLAYILAHNLYQRAKELRQTQSTLEETEAQKDIYQGVLRDLLSAETLEQLAEACAKDLEVSSKEKETGFWSSFGLSSSSSAKNASLPNPKTILSIQTVLQQQLQDRIGDHILTDEERRIKEMQQAWQESQQLGNNTNDDDDESSPEQELLASVLQGDDEGIEKAAADSSSPSGKKQQRRVISM